MKRYKQPLTLAALLLAALLWSLPARADVLAIDGERLTVQWPLSVPRDSLSANYALETVPMLVCGSDTVLLDPVTFRAPLNMKTTRRGRKFRTVAPGCGDELRTGETALVSATLSRADYPALWSGPVCLIAAREKSGCCSVEPLAPLQVASVEYRKPFVPSVAPVPDFTGKAGELQKSSPVLQHISQYRPYTKDRILRKEKGALYVHFPLDKTDVRRDFRDNAAILDQIVDITRQIMADSASSVKVIQIIGLASVEGPLRHNEELAGSRADALKRYVQQHVAVPDSLFECYNGGEAWTELRDQINDLDFPYREALLEIIDTEPAPERREARIKALDSGKAYAYLRDNVLSDQRNSGYLRIYYDYVPDEAAAAINGASELLAAERYAEALERLLPVKADPRSWNALGVALYMTGDHDAAIEYFRKSAANGNPQAAENLDCLTTP